MTCSADSRDSDSVPYCHVWVALCEDIPHENSGSFINFDMIHIFVLLSTVFTIYSILQLNIFYLLDAFFHVISSSKIIVESLSAFILIVNFANCQCVSHLWILSILISVYRFYYLYQKLLMIQKGLFVKKLSDVGKHGRSLLIFCDVTFKSVYN